MIGVVCKDDIATPPVRARHSASDAELIEAIAGKDELAFGELVRRVRRDALSVALRVVREQALAEDAVQEALLSVWRRASQFDPRRGELRGWISAIVHNAAIDTLRRRETALHADEDVLAEIPDETDESEIAWEESAAALRSALGTLPCEQSSVIELHYFGGYSLLEVASMSSTPLGTVKSRLRLGIEKLRIQIGVGRADSAEQPRVYAERAGAPEERGAREQNVWAQRCRRGAPPPHTAG